MSRPPLSARPGFTILEMAIVLLIIGLIGSLLVGASTAYLQSHRRQAVRTQLDALDVALVNFVVQNKRLPCPADGRSPTGSSGAGAEVLAAGVCNVTIQQFGVLPWVTLGLQETDVTDPWTGRFTYRVDPALAATGTLLMNMSNCDPASTGAAGAGGICQVPAGACTGTANCTAPANYLANKGLDVWDGQNGAAGFAVRQNNRANGSGAAYVLISHGENGLGAYNRSGIFLGTPTVSDNEPPNANGQVLALPATQVSVYRDAPLNDNPGCLSAAPPAAPTCVSYPHFDDYLSHPTIMAVLVKANLGPRAH